MADFGECVICGRPFTPRLYFDSDGRGQYTRTCQRSCANRLAVRLRMSAKARRDAANLELGDYWQACPQIECTDARSCQGYQGSAFEGGCLVPEVVRKSYAAKKTRHQNDAGQGSRSVNET